MQLYVYEHLNKKYKRYQDLKNYKEGKAEPTFEIALQERIEQLTEEKLKTLDIENGEDISPDDLVEIYRDANEDVRHKMNLITSTRNKTGELEDYLEVRRPFGLNEKSKI